MFIRFDRIHERDRQTDTQTPHDGIGGACIASRGKNWSRTPLSKHCRLIEIYFHKMLTTE